MTICNASIIAMEATIGNSKALSWDEPSSMLDTDTDTVDTLSSILLLADSSVEPNCDVSSFSF